MMCVICVPPFGSVMCVRCVVKKHPGGVPILLQHQSEPDSWDSFEETGHSNSAIEKMNEFLIGRVDKASVEEAVKSGRAKKRTGDGRSATSLSSTMLVFGVIMLGFVARYLFHD